MPEVANALPRGFALHEYRVESVLGAGGFGLTYLATDSNLNLKVALKEYLPSDFASRSEDSTVQPKPGEAAESFQWGLQRFMDEARTLASFRHPNIVRVMRFFEANHTGYMVMEFVEGMALPDWIGSRRPLAQPAFVSLVTPLLEGLEVIHKAGYLHRDIKPANIFMRADGSPVLIDFGSARQTTGAQELTAVVSPGYAPLEQYHAHGKQGPWTDLYAFGGVMYWMLTGNKPVEAAARVREDIMAPAAKLGAGRGYSGEFLAVVDWALKPNENERPQSVAEFKRRLMGGPQPASTDRTIPVSAADAPTQIARPSDSGGMTGLTGVVLDREQVKRVEAELARHIGPIAPVVTRNAAKKALSIPALAEAVAGEIADVKARAAFVKKFVSGDAPSKPAGATVKAPDLTVSQKFSPDVLQKAESALAQYIGAIAKVVVKRSAAKARDEAELYLLIADEIKDPAERKAFVRKAVSVHR